MGMTYFIVPAFIASLFIITTLYIGKTPTMIKRLSSSFKKGRPKEEESANGRQSPQKSVPDQAATSPRPEKKDAENTHHAVKREEVQSSFQQYAQLIHAAQRPLPTQSGDGSYIEETVPSGMMQDLKNLGFQDMKTLMAVMKTKATGALADDKTYLMEKVIQLVSGLPANSKSRIDLTSSFVDELFNSLQHPPLT